MTLSFGRRGGSVYWRYTEVWEWFAFCAEDWLMEKDCCDPCWDCCDADAIWGGCMLVKLLDAEWW